VSMLALFNTTMALRQRLIDAATVGSAPPIPVHVGSPLAGEIGDSMVSLTLFDVRPGAAMRNTPRFASPSSRGPVAGGAAQIRSVPLELRYLVVCYRRRVVGNQAGGFPTELETLGRIIAAFEEDPALAIAAETEPDEDPAVAELAQGEQNVRLSLDGYGLDEWNRLWGLFPDTAFRTSLVYLASPVFIDIGEAGQYPRVMSRRADGGLAS
jgi:hypothetical protein